MKSITIIGGGLAGLSLGIALRRQDVPTMVYEAARYPRHRVCGEFVSGAGQQAIERLGLVRQLTEAGARLAEDAAFFWPRNSSPPRRLPTPALCLSRYAMDAALADEFRKSGGTLVENHRWRGNAEDEGIVRATGRQSYVYDRGWKWIGLKAHATHVSLSADLEMHVAKNAYVGICQLSGGVVNICGLVRRSARDKTALRPTEWLRGNQGDTLHERLANAVFEPLSVCAVAGLCLRPTAEQHQNECRIGDALTMIPPITGNGMSMAFEAAQIAVGPLAEYARGHLSWPEAGAEVRRLCVAAFRARLAWAAWLQILLFSPIVRTRVGVHLLGSKTLWNLLFQRTR